MAWALALATICGIYCCLRVGCGLSCHCDEIRESHEQSGSELRKQYPMEATRPLFIPVILGTARTGRMSLRPARDQ